MERAPATAALAVSCTTPWATPSWISGSGAFATPSASKPRGRVEPKRGESDRFTAGAATRVPSRPTSAPWPSACSSPLNAQRPSSSSSSPTAAGSNTTG